MGTASSPLRGAILFSVAIFLAFPACQRTPVETPEPAAAAPQPALPALPPAGAVRFRVNAEESDLRVIVYRGGPLAQFGHNHVLRAGDLRGDVYLAPEFSRSAFSLEFSPAAFIVDPQDARVDEGPDFATQPSQQAIEGTRANLLGPKVLNAARFPAITLRSVAFAGSAEHPVVTARVGLHGVERDLGFPVSIEPDTDRLVANGTLLLSTPDYGIPSFTVMGGGLKVMEEVKIKFRIVAVKER